jgi:serine/threonine protein kinase
VLLHLGMSCANTCDWRWLCACSKWESSCKNQVARHSLNIVMLQAADDENKVDEIVSYSKTGRQAGGAWLIPRSTLSIPDEAFKAGASVLYGAVVPALLDANKVAVKLFNFVQRQMDTTRALREALLLNQLPHPNVVRCLGIVDDPDTEPSKSIHGSLVMDWVGGGQLFKWLQVHDKDEDGELPQHVRLQVALQVAAGMSHLHACGVVHGDLKPQNVLLHNRPVSLTECPQVSHSQPAPACPQVCSIGGCSLLA